MAPPQQSVPPKGTRHKHKTRTTKAKTRPTLPSGSQPRRPCPSPDEINDSDLADDIKKKFKWTHEPREFQMQAIKAQLCGQDVLVRAGTGSGKTAIAAGPHAHASSEGMTTLFVSPLIALQREQVS